MLQIPQPHSAGADHGAHASHVASSSRDLISSKIKPSPTYHNSFDPHHILNWTRPSISSSPQSKHLSYHFTMSIQFFLASPPQCLSFSSFYHSSQLYPIFLHKISSIPFQQIYPVLTHHGVSLLQLYYLHYNSLVIAFSILLCEKVLVMALVMVCLLLMLT